jgi:hypothetical protein
LVQILYQLTAAPIDAPFAVVLYSGMALLSTAAEYQAVREAIQQLTTLGTDGTRRDTVSFTIGDMSYTYNSSQLPALQSRELELARRLTIRNVRKRTECDFS